LLVVGVSAAEPLHDVQRATLGERTLARLNEPGWRHADVLLVRDRAGAVVVKDFARRGSWLRRAFGAWVVERELRAYQRLSGVPCVPRLLGRLDAWALVLEYRPGEMLTRALRGRVGADFVRQLRETVLALHERGVVHGDLRHRSNVLAGEDGRPVVLDLATSLCFRPGGWAARRLLPHLARLDWKAVAKWERKFAHPPASEGTAAPVAAEALAASEAASLGSRGASRPT
jgi:hypothetical protein